MVDAPASPATAKAAPKLRYTDIHPVTVANPEGTNHRHVCYHFTRDRLLLCAANAVALEDIACKLAGPSNQAARDDLAGQVLVIAREQLQLLLKRDWDISDQRAALADIGITDDMFVRIFN